MDLNQMVLDAVCAKSHENGLKEGFAKGSIQGACEMERKLMVSFKAASTVTKVVYDGMRTIVRFEDGGYEIVTYDSSYGYAYDEEKAIMAGILKHIVGNSYIKPLMTFGKNPKGCPCNCEHYNVSNNMINRNAYESDEGVADVYTDKTPDGDPVNLSDFELMMHEIEEMDSDILVDFDNDVN